MLLAWLLSLLVCYSNPRVWWVWCGVVWCGVVGTYSSPGQGGVGVPRPLGRAAGAGLLGPRDPTGGRNAQHGGATQGPGRVGLRGKSEGVSRVEGSEGVSRVEGSRVDLFCDLRMLDIAVTLLVLLLLQQYRQLLRILTTSCMSYSSARSTTSTTRT